jgi:methionyl aminopeptidase
MLLSWYTYYISIEIRTMREIEEMRPAGKFVAEVLQTLNGLIKPGMNLLEIDDITHKMIDQRGAISCYVDYAPAFGEGPFGHYICTSVNDAVLHGIPHDYTLVTGDVLSLDFACSVNGWVADSAFTTVVGASDQFGGVPEDVRKLMNTTQHALELGISVARAGNRIGDISATIGDYCHSQGYSINTDYGGHGVGRIMHGDPHVPNDGIAGRGHKIRPGLVIAIEPWLLNSTDEIYTDSADGWTIRSEDGSIGSHFEHTIAVTDSVPIILTAWD